MKVVLDTDVVRSGLQSDVGASRLLLCGVAQQVLTPVITQSVLSEYEDVLLRPESLIATGFTYMVMLEFLNAMVGWCDKVQVHYSFRPAARDPNDDMFVDALLNSGADAIVTFNRRDYLSDDPREASLGHTVIPVINPGQALRRLRWRPAAIMPFVFPFP